MVWCGENIMGRRIRTSGGEAGEGGGGGIGLIKRGWEEGGG